MCREKSRSGPSRGQKTDKCCPKVECLTWTRYNILQLTMNLSTDLILLIIPVVMVSRLKMKIGK